MAINRRHFIKTLGLAAASLAVPGLAGIEGTKSSRDGKSKPNILIILADDMGYSDPGYMGGEAKTPHLDRLSRGG